VLAAAYPDVFTSAIVSAGVPAGCFRAKNESAVAQWSSDCAQGRVTHSSSEWASIVYSMSPLNSSMVQRPRMQIYHGGQDDILHPVLYTEIIKQWSGVLGYNTTALSIHNTYPAVGYETFKYGERLEGVFARDTGHNLKAFLERDMEWFGFRSVARFE
jgi:acetylxylan esterase